jgi:hypothetical protein
MSSVSSVESIRIVSLPRELQNEADVSCFLKKLIGVEQINVNIARMKSEAGVVYRSAYVVVGKWTDASIHERIRLAGAAGTTFSDIVDPKDGGVDPLDFHFDNGKPMTHIKIQAVQKRILAASPLPLEVDSWTGVYVPVVPSDLELYQGESKCTTEEYLTEFFQNRMRIGEVSRVDIVTKTNASGGAVSSAHVQFHMWYNNKSARKVRDVIAERGEFVCKGFYEGVRFQNFARNRYILLKIDRKPISAEAAALRTKDDELAVLKTRIAELEKMVAVPSTTELFAQLRQALIAKAENGTDCIEDMDLLRELYEEAVPLAFR